MLYRWAINHSPLLHCLRRLVILSMQYIVDLIKFLLTVANVYQYSLNGNLYLIPSISVQFCLHYKVLCLATRSFVSCCRRRTCCSYFCMPASPLHSERIFSAAWHMQFCFQQSIRLERVFKCCHSQTKNIPIQVNTLRIPID